MKKLSILFIVLLVLTVSCRKLNEIRKDLRNFNQVNLVDNNGEYNATHMDPTLMNAWGLAFSSGGTPWVNSTDGHVSEVYSAEGDLIPQRPRVNIPSPTD